FAVRDHGQTHIPKVAQFYSGQIRQNGALLLRRLAQFCSGVDIAPCCTEHRFRLGLI
ncbi:MAG: hypothetical protein ACI9KK_002252, partial [Ascidiaceihabitans sp.]